MTEEPRAEITLRDVHERLVQVEAGVLVIRTKLDFTYTILLPTFLSILALAAGWFLSGMSHG